MQLPPAPAWVEEATAAFSENPELQLAARHELSALGKPEEAARTGPLTKRFRELNAHSLSQKKTRQRLRAVLLVLPLVVLALLYLTDARKLRQLQGVLGGFGPLSFIEEEQIKERPARGLAPAEKLLLLGDPEAPTKELQWKALWDSDPGNPSYYSEYINHTKPLPPGFLETVRTIDPDNGWFLLVKAGELAKEAVEKDKTAPRKKIDHSLPPEERHRVADSARQVSEWTIHDQELLEEAIALFLEAASKPRFEHYDTMVLKQRLELLPPERDFLSRIPRVMHAVSSTSSQLFLVLYLSDAISARSRQLADPSRQEQLQALITANEILTKRLAEGGDTLLAQLVFQAVANKNHEHLLDAAEKAGMEPEAELLRARVLALRKSIYHRKTHDHPGEDILSKHGGVYAALFTPVGFNVAPGIPAPSADDLKPGRLMEYAIGERMALFLAILVLILLILLIPLLALPLRGKLARLLGARLGRLPTLGDQVFILLLGTGAPLLWYLLLCKGTLLGCRDLGLRYMFLEPARTQILITFALILATTAQAVRWRLRPYFSPLATGPRRPRLGWLPPLLLVEELKKSAETVTGREVRLRVRTILEVVSEGL